MKSVITYSKKALLIVFFCAAGSCFFSASAQQKPLNSRVAVVSNETKTNIWVSDFPKKTSVVITDGNDNLLSIVSTNDFGAAYITLPTSIKTVVIAKTLNGEITVSNRAVVKDRPAETAAAVTNSSNKA